MPILTLRGGAPEPWETRGFIFLGPVRAHRGVPQRGVFQIAGAGRLACDLHSHEAPELGFMLCYCRLEILENV